MNITVNLECKTYVSKDGTIPLTFRICINGKNDYLKLGRRIKAVAYDFKKHTLKKGFKGYHKTDVYITDKKSEVNGIIETLEKQRQLITFAKIKDAYNKDTFKNISLTAQSTCFYEFLETEMQKDRNENTYSEYTISGWAVTVNLLKKHNPNLKTYEVNLDYVKGVVAWMIERGAAQSYRYGVLSYLKKYSGRLYKQGLITEEPFDSYPVGTTQPTEPEYLNQDEVALLHNIYLGKGPKAIMDKWQALTPKKHEVFKGVLQHVLVSIYSGLRYGDIKTIGWKNLRDNYIVKKMEKGFKGEKRTVRVPVYKRFFEVVSPKSESNSLFTSRVYGNHHTNRVMRELFALSGVEKYMTFHGLRHTFAINSLLLGIPIEVVSSLLGHSSLRTTQLYGRIVDSLKERHMKKWDNLGQKALKAKASCPVCDTVALEYTVGAVNGQPLQIACPSCAFEFSHSFGVNVA